MIDNCDVPEALKSTLWERIEETANFDEPLKRILAAIFEVREKPAIGTPPEFVQKAALCIDGLSSIDALVLRRAAAFDLEKNSHIIEPESIFTDLDAIGLTKGQVQDSIEVLGSDGYFEVSHYFGGGADRFGCHIRLTDYGLERYCSSEVEDYDQLKEQCAGLIVNEEIRDNRTLAAKTRAKLRLIEHILDILKSNGLIEITKFLGGNISIHHVHPKFRRMLS